jgi:phage tail tube protein FII
MKNSHLTLTGVSLYCGDADPNDAIYLTLKSIQLPDLQEKMIEISGAGAPMDFEAGTRQMNALMLSFSLHGFNPNVDKHFMSPTGKRLKYTIRGNLYDSREQVDQSYVGVVEGRMTKATPSQFERSSGTDFDYEVRSISSYEYSINGGEKFYSNLFEGPAATRVDGVPVHQDFAANLGLL